MVTGVQQSASFDETVDALIQTGKSASRIVSASLRTSMRINQKGIVAAVPDALTPGHTNASIKATIGVRVRSKGGQITEAKVGINVGKKNPRQRGSETAEQFQARKDAIKPGDMVSATAHLIATGTRERWSGIKDIRRRRKGKDIVIGQKFTGNRLMYRGRVKPSGFVKIGATATASEADAVLKRELNKRITKCLTGQLTEAVSA